MLIKPMFVLEGKILVYEHIYGLPSNLDSVEDEITGYVIESCETIEQAERLVEEINHAIPEDRYGRRRNLYIWRKT